MTPSTAVRSAPIRARARRKSLPEVPSSEDSKGSGASSTAVPDRSTATGSASAERTASMVVVYGCASPVCARACAVFSRCKNSVGEMTSSAPATSAEPRIASTVVPARAAVAVRLRATWRGAQVPSHDGQVQALLADPQIEVQQRGHKGEEGTRDDVRERSSDEADDGSRQAGLQGAEGERDRQNEADHAGDQ